MKSFEKISKFNKTHRHQIDIRHQKGGMKKVTDAGVCRSMFEKAK